MLRTNGKEKIVFFLILFFLPSSWVYAENDLKLRTHGFFTQGYIKSKDNNFFGNSSGKGSLNFTEIGVNASIQPLAQLHTSAQLLLRQAGESDTADLALDFAIIDYRLQSSPIFNSGIRVGRIKNTLGFYNETRDIAFTRPSVILPQSIYFDRVRDVALSSNGGQIYGFYSSSIMDVQLQISAAKPLLSKDTEIALFSTDLPGALDPKFSYGSKINIEFFQGRLNFAYSDIYLNIDYGTTTGQALNNPNLKFNPRVFSARFLMKNFIFSTEYALRKFKFNEMKDYVPFSSQTGESYYFQIVYLLNHDIRLLARYDVTYLNKDDKSGKKFSARFDGKRPDFTQFAKDFTVGIQWKLNHSWLFMIEQHWVRGTAWLPIQDNIDLSQEELDFGQLKRDWWMFNALVSYRF